MTIKGSIRIRSASKSDPGRVRSRNEDNFSCDESVGLFLVADGMGGHAGGQTASRVSANTVHDLVTEFSSLGPGEPLEENQYIDFLASAVKQAGDRIFELGNQQLELRGMGTTTTALWIPNGFDPPRAFLSHVGDSRAYRLRAARIEQLTRDHSWVMEQVRAGHLTIAEAKTHRFRSLITRSVGFQSTVEVDTTILDLAPGDSFLLCSDGLSNYIGEAELQHVLETVEPEQAVEELVSQANARGGQDNITVVIVQILPA